MNGSLVCRISDFRHFIYSGYTVGLNANELILMLTVFELWYAHEIIRLPMAWTENKIRKLVY